MSTFSYSDLPPVGDIPTWAAILDVHTDSIRRACRNGELKYVTLGRLWRIPRHAVIEWLTQNDPAADNDGTVQTADAAAYAGF